MRSHRQSYLKTTLAALGMFLVSAASILSSWTWIDAVVLRWVAASTLFLLALACLLIALGGFLALQGDSREGRASGVRRSRISE